MSVDARTGTADRRASRKIETFRRIQEEAIRLFLEKGYHGTTVEEIAAAAGVSHMTVFRYFPTKEALVVTDEYDLDMFATIRDRPADETPVEALFNALRETLLDLPPPLLDRTLVRMRLIAEVPALHGAMWNQWLVSHDTATEALAARIGPEADRFALRLLVSATLGAGMAVAQAWTESNGTLDFADLLDEALAALRNAFC